jgi:hypothetical protein
VERKDIPQQPPLKSAWTYVSDETPVLAGRL